ncbi:hypothetical protein PR202_ga02814 [Eleusine coracana subsp. coracana]|uniref:Serine protease n=1 Tax=Eleusine coracana subsp. coracana TaxID=191504 RepID=A0AAV5BMG5_ELECO|nr:hypothetical protein QOZ80_2AG0146480 [Eleusine coracana subsp. coracana]GJM86914.1 hypothetical protein PR202_ga02814 [Eleusine coracana subsp. coracana]
MANPAIPNAFSNFVHQCVCDEKAKSLFFIKVTSKADNYQQMMTHLTDVCKMTEEKAHAAVTSSQFATGFVVGETEIAYRILTCAHVFEKYYSAEYQLTMQQLGQWFQVLVICQHNEEHMARTFPNRHANPNIDDRLYTAATIVRCDQRRDLMLLEVSKQYLYGTHTFVRCQMPHPVLRFANAVPRQLDDVSMVSWPPNRDDTPVIGQVVKQSREYGQMTSDLSKGYNMRLMELNINGDNGSSGAPILNQHGRVISMYHGRASSMGYGVSAYDMREFLAQN